MPSSATPLALIGDDIFVTGEIMVDEEAQSLVDHKLFHQRRADAHGHCANHPAARRLGVQDAARRAHGDHPPHTDLGRCGGVHADCDEVRDACVSGLSIGNSPAPGAGTAVGHAKGSMSVGQVPRSRSCRQASK